MSAPISRTRRVAAALALTGVLALTSAACDLRLETPAPTEPTRTAAELLRSRAVDDALTLEQAARTARATAAGSAGAVAPVLDDVVAFSAAHVSELGGVYSSGLHPSPSATPTASATGPASTPTDVLSVLASSAADALGTADSVPDGGMARLLAAIGTSRAQLATRLATALGAPPPAIAPRNPAPAPSAGTTTPAAGARPAGGPSPAGTSRATAGLSPEDLDTLTVVEDQAGYGLEVVAAKLDGAGRARALAAAREHRAAAEAWAVQAGTAATPRDPRRAAYALPSGLRDAATATALARSLEDAVARTDATMVAAASPGSRGALVADLRSAADAATSWGEAPVPLPGMPQQPVPTASPNATAGGSPAPAA